MPSKKKITPLRFLSIFPEFCKHASIEFDTPAARVTLKMGKGKAAARDVTPRHPSLGWARSSAGEQQARRPLPAARESLGSGQGRARAQPKALPRALPDDAGAEIATPRWPARRPAYFSSDRCCASECLFASGWFVAIG